MALAWESHDARESVPWISERRQLAAAPSTPRPSQNLNETTRFSLHQHCFEEFFGENGEGYCCVSSKKRKEFTFVEMSEDFGWKRACSYLHNFTCRHPGTDAFMETLATQQY